MLLVTVCFLIITSVVAGGYGNDSGPKPFPVMQQYHRATTPPAYPMDYNDDMYNRDFRIKSNSNKMYNYEQIRRDRTPQMDKRMENVAKYMYRYPETTTLHPNNNFRVNDAGNDRIYQHSYYDSAPALTYGQHWKQMSEHPTTMPPKPTPTPSPAPQWHDFSESFNHPIIPYSKPYKEQKSNEALDFSMPMHYSPSYEPQDQAMWYSQADFPGPKRVATPDTEVKEIRQSFTQYHDPPYPSEVYDHPAPKSSSSVPPVMYDINHRFENDYPVQRPLPYNKQETIRGSKFDWNDVVLNNHQDIVSTTSDSVYQYQKKLPPVPTLTPWFDGYRK